jgi:hypothetical protein
MKKVAKIPIFTKKSGTTVRRCVCKHAFQDTRYGSGMRLCNITGSNGSRCTVCSREEKL